MVTFDPVRETIRKSVFPLQALCSSSKYGQTVARVGVPRENKGPIACWANFTSFAKQTHNEGEIAIDLSAAFFSGFGCRFRSSWIAVSLTMSTEPEFTR